MSFLSTSQLATLLKSYKVVSPFDPVKVKNGAYELALGDQVFLTSDSPQEIRRIAEGGEIWIEPGQFALLLTEEYLKVPEHTIAFISIKAKMKWKGLVNVSGFHVDPGFQGKLLFSVYNAGSYRITLRRGEQYFPIWFAKLANDERQRYEGSHGGQTNISVEAIEALSQGELASPSALSARIDENQRIAEKKIDDNQMELIRRISLIEKEQTAKDYLVKTAVGLGIVLLVKFGLDWLMYNNGVQKGIELKKSEIAADSVINKKLIEQRNLLMEIDSLQKARAILERQ